MIVESIRKSADATVEPDGNQAPVTPGIACSLFAVGALMLAPILICAALLMMVIIGWHLFASIAVLSGRESNTMFKGNALYGLWSHRSQRALTNIRNASKTLHEASELA